jgi:hypothetical protein
VLLIWVGAALSGCGGGGSSTTGNSAATTTTTTTTGQWLLGPAGPAVAATINSADSTKSQPLQAVFAVDAKAPSTPQKVFSAGEAKLVSLTMQFSGADLGIRHYIYTNVDGRIYGVDRSAGIVTPAVISTLNTASSCLGNGFMPLMNLYQPARTWLVLKVPGVDGKCETGDDGYQAIRVDMNSNTAPLVLDSYPLTEFEDAKGDLIGLVALRGSNLVVLDADLQNPVAISPVVATSSLSLNAHVSYVDGRNILLYQDAGKVWGVDLSSASRTPVSLVTLASGDNLNIPTDDGSNVYLWISSGSSGERVIRVSSALQTSVVASLNTASNYGSLANVSGNRLVFGSYGSTNSTVVSMPKAGASSWTTLRTASSGPISWIELTHENAWISYQDSSTSALQAAVVTLDGSVSAALGNSHVLGSLVNIPSGTSLNSGVPEGTYADGVLVLQGASGEAFTTILQAGSSLALYDGNTRGLLKKLGTFPSAPSGRVDWVGPTLMLGAASLFEYVVIDANGNPTNGDLYFARLDSSGQLVKITSNLGTAAPASAVEKNTAALHAEAASVSGSQSASPLFSGVPDYIKRRLQRH